MVKASMKMKMMAKINKKKSQMQELLKIIELIAI